MQLVQEGFAGHGHTVFAHEQTAGKGQRGKVWNADPNSNIIVSVVLDTAFLQLHQQFLLNMAVASAVHEFYSHFGGDETRMKWPNDIYWQNRKAGGILIENIVRGSLWKWAVVGIGLNINQARFPEHLHKAVSLKQITGKEFEVVELTKKLCGYLDKYYRQLMADGGEGLLQRYNDFLYKRGEQVKLKKENVVFNCTVDGVSSSGQLLVSGALYHTFSFGEVEWII